MDFAMPTPPDGCSWASCAGVWEEHYVIPVMIWPKPPYITFQTSFMAEFSTIIPTCLRFHNPYLLKDGRTITGTIEEDGEPGEPGWHWRFYVTEPVEGPVIWHVETTDCPKVAGPGDVNTINGTRACGVQR